MDYRDDHELASLLSRSDQLNRRSDVVNEHCTRLSAVLRELLMQSEAICADSDRLCGKPYRGRQVARRARRLQEG